MKDRVSHTWKALRERFAYGQDHPWTTGLKATLFIKKFRQSQTCVAWNSPSMWHPGGLTFDFAAATQNTPQGPVQRKDQSTWHHIKEHNTKQNPKQCYISVRSPKSQLLKIMNYSSLPSFLYFFSAFTSFYCLFILFVIYCYFYSQAQFFLTKNATRSF